MSFTSRYLLPALLLAVLFSPAPSRADEAADQYSVAAGHYVQQRWQSAVDEFESFLRAYPEHARAPQAMFFTGEALVQLGRHADALKYFEQLLDRYPSNHFARQAMFRRAEAAYSAGQHKHAQALLDEFHKQYPDDELNEYVLPYLAEILLEQHQAEAAQKLFAKAVDLYPRGAMIDECRLGLAKADEALGRHDAARRGYRELAAGSQPLADQAQFQLALLENAAGEFDAALEALEPLTKSSDNPHRGKALLERGWALYKLKRYADAEACFSQLAEHDAENFEARYWLGLVRAADTRWTAAIEPLLAVEAGATNPLRVMQCRAALAICYAHAERVAEARAAYAAFEQGQPSAELWNSTTYQLADAAFGHDTAWAAELFESLTKEGTAAEYMAKGLSGLAWCQFQSSDTAGSVATFDRLLAEHPNDPLAAEAALVRGQALEKLGQGDAALAMYELVIDKYPQSRQLSEALWKAARLQHRLARAEQAEAIYRRLSEERPPFAQYDALLYHWSRVLEELKRPDEAAKLIERLRRDWPASALVSDASFRLAEREWGLKNYDSTIALLSEIVATEPAPKVLPQALYLQGRMALEREQWTEVRQPLERLVRDFPDSPLVLAAHYWTAEAAYRQKDYARASEAFAALEREAAGRTEKWLAMIPLRRAQSLAQLNQWPTALEVATGIEKQYPNFEDQYEADYIIGRALASQGEFAQARDAYTKVLRSTTGAKSETAAMAQWMIGETYFHQESYQAAVAAYLRVEILYAYPKWQAGALLQAGKCHETLGHWTEASDLYARLIKTYPDTEFTDEAKRRLSVAQQRGTKRG